MRLQFLTTSLVVLLACSGMTGDAQRPERRLSRDEFVQIMVELQHAGADSSGRAAVLEKHGATIDDVRAFVRAYAHDVAGLSEAFDSIQTKLDRDLLRR